MKDNRKKQNSASFSVEAVAIAAREAAVEIAKASSSKKNEALCAAADALEENRSLVMDSNSSRPLTA